MSVCVVTGASRGLGLEITKSLASAGHKVYALTRVNNAQSDIVKEIKLNDYNNKIICLQCDVRLPESVSRVADYISGVEPCVDLLVNNAGIATIRNFKEISVGEWNNTIATNLNGVFYCCHFFLKLLAKSDSPDIINISSRSGKNPAPNLAAYCASKFGLNGLTEVMQADLMADGIRVSTIAPGRCATDFANETKEDWHIPATAISDAVINVINSDRRVFWGNLEIRPIRN